MALHGDLETAIEDDGVYFRFEVTNDGNSAKEITFRDAGRVDVAVERKSMGERESDEGRGVHWRYSDDRGFAQVIKTERLDRGKSATYECRWPSPDPGTYVARATLRAYDCDLEAECEFSVDEQV